MRSRSRRRRSSSSRNFPGRRKEADPAQVEALLKHRRAARAGHRRISRSSTRRTTRRARRSSRGCGTRCSTSSRRSSPRTSMALKAGYPRAEQQALARGPALGAGAPRALQGPRRQVPAVPLQPLDSGAMARIPRALRVRAHARLAARAARARRRRAFPSRACSFEQEYLKTLLLMRLDSGNFTPDQVEWVAQQLEDWAPSLALHRRRRAMAPDSSSTHRARRVCAGATGRTVGGRVLFLDASPRLRAHRRADALAARARRRSRRSQASCRRASNACC